MRSSYTVESIYISCIETHTQRGVISLWFVHAFVHDTPEADDAYLTDTTRILASNTTGHGLPPDKKPDVYDFDPQCSIVNAMALAVFVTPIF